MASIFQKLAWVFFLTIATHANSQPPTEKDSRLESQGKAITQLHTEIALLKNEIFALKEKDKKLAAETNTLRWAHNIAVQYWLVSVCAANKIIPKWVNYISGLKPFPIGTHVCPNPGTRIYIPFFFGSPPVVIEPPPT